VVESIKLIDHHFSVSDFQPRILQQVRVQKLNFAQNRLFSKGEIDVEMQAVNTDA
jgi:hypothetical protein